MSFNNTKKGFSVKDLLDLPDTNGGSGTEETEDENEEETSEIMTQNPSFENAGNVPCKSLLCDGGGNSYSRWLASSNSIQYSCERVAIPVLIRDGKPCDTSKTQELEASFRAGIPLSAYSAYSLHHMHMRSHYSPDAMSQLPSLHHLAQMYQWTW
ncbi:unnamed protein product [Coregonus sp. 'balchen']|nr:unnamed protein product [Coregonus sp. 'balchen']